MEKLATSSIYTLVTSLTAYSEAEGTVSIDVQMTVCYFCIVNKSVVDWLPSNYGL